VLFPPDSPWLRYVAWARVTLAAATLGFSLLPDGSPDLFRLVAGAFLLCATVLAIRVKALTGILGLLALFADLMFFLAVASLAPQRMMWMAFVIFVGLLAEALALYSAMELIVISTVCVFFCGVLPNPQIRQLQPTVLVTGVLSCGFAVARRRQDSRFEAARQQISELEKAADRAREGERQRIASDFHDGPLQSFISLQMRLEILRKLLDRDYNAGAQDLKELQALAQSQVRDLRAFLHSMRPVDVDGANLVSTARRAAEMFQKESGIPVTFLGTNIPVGLPQEMSLEVLQILRESLHNVQKHAGATRVAVAMDKTDRGLEISVDDNGHGFPFAGTFSLDELELLRLGPASLKRRARSLNAEMLVESRPGRGAGLKFRIPLQ
jgi:signal transduction histidine kinase